MAQRLIDANAFKKENEQLLHCDFPYLSETTLEELIDDAPTIDAEPVRHGKWIVWDEIIAGIYHTVSECSECGFTTDKMFREEMPYCPNCGCRMDKDE